MHVPWSFFFTGPGNDAHHMISATDFYFYIENLVLWAGSEIDASALKFCV